MHRGCIVSKLESLAKFKPFPALMENSKDFCELLSVQRTAYVFNGIKRYKIVSVKYSLFLCKNLCYSISRREDTWKKRKVIP